jgi:DNA (cytosine-5)-methyltransferase 1
MNQSFENKEAYINKVDNQIYKTPGITLGSLFDGIGGFPYAGSFYGITPVWASEILPQAVSVTKRHFPQMEHVGDITKLDGAKLPPVDIITFGSPCQDLSTAGKRVGMSGERSGLFMEAIRIIFEMRRATNGKYPRYALWENVPGAMSSTGGRDFQAVLEAFTKTEIPMSLSGKWANAGMVRSDGVDLAWRVLNAQHFGVPQRRRRIFLVCDFGGESAGEILFIEESVRGNPAPGSKARQGTAADAQGSVGSADESSVAFACNQRDEVRDLHDVSAAICAQPGMKQQTFIAKDVQCMNPWDTQQSRVFTGDGASPTLAGADGGGGRNPAGLVFCSASSQSHAGIAKELAGALTCQHEPPFVCEPELARTLTARGDSSPCADRGQNVVVVPAGKECAGFCAGAGAEARSIGYERETAPTIKGGAGGFQMPTAVFNKDAVSVHQNGSGELSASNITKSLPTMSTSSCRNAPLVAQASGVTSKGNGDCFLSHECHCALTSGGGQAGQGYPAVMEAHPKVSGTLCASGAGLSRPAGMASEPDLCVAYALQGNMIGRQEHNGPSGNGVSENLSYTLTATDVPAVSTSEPIPIQDKATRYKGGGPTRNGDGAGNGLGVGKPGDPAPTLTSDHHAVAAVDCRNHRETGEVSGTLQAKENGSYSLNYQNPVRTGYIVRRLTPTECERLQGYPDGWTAIGHDGKEISDTRRYQMLGNSVAIPCVAYILSGIAAQIEKANIEEAA